MMTGPWQMLMIRWRRAALPAVCTACVLLLAACGQSATGPGSAPDGPDAPGGGAPPQQPPVADVTCAPDLPALELTGSVARTDAKTYALMPFVVGEGTGRIEVAYGWTEGGPANNTPLTATTLDLGLWDADGYREPEGFRGWSGSRQGRLDQETGPVFVTAESADRGYVPGAIEPGTWHVELGIAAVGPSGADWLVRIECLADDVGALPPPDPVDPAHVANPAAGWYHGDFHMHAFHSQPNAPDWGDFIAQSRAADLDFLMVTEYVTGRHWQTLGAVARDNPDLIIWPGREIITYFGHANTFGETPEVLDYRHGFEDVNLGDIQARSVAAGALFGVNHPTTFQGPLFENFCRGCAFELGDAIDWAAVDTLEVQNGPALVTGGEVGLPIPGQIQNPFTLTALDFWDARIAEGFFPTGVSGSDSKGIDAPEERARKGYGSSATAVFAENLSRPALAAAIRAGHAYIRTLGVAGSPEATFTVATNDGQTGMYGDTVTADTAMLTTTITGGDGQRLTYVVDGQAVRTVPVIGETFTDTWTVARLPTSSALGTAVRIEVANEEVITVIGNPVFLAAP